MKGTMAGGLLGKGIGLNSSDKILFFLFIKLKEKKVVPCEVWEMLHSRCVGFVVNQLVLVSHRIYFCTGNPLLLSENFK